MAVNSIEDARQRLESVRAANPLLQIIGYQLRAIVGQVLSPPADDMERESWVIDYQIMCAARRDAVNEWRAAKQAAARPGL
jgi:hypothetical protein